MRFRTIHGKMERELQKLAPESIDSVVTDPPYELNFMGKGWDNAGLSFDPATWRECYRVLRPGGYLLAFGGTRTFHRIAVAIEDAGFEIRDTLIWLYGSGFPKSLDVSKAIDKAAGATRQNRNGQGDHEGTVNFGMKNRCPTCNKPYFSANPCTCPRLDKIAMTTAAEQWQGWGTALKPAYEPIIMARKPLVGTVANNVLTHGTGALNIDACRIGTTKDVPASVSRGRGDSQNSLEGSVDGSLRNEDGSESGHNPNIGRWPANVLLTHHPECKRNCVGDCPVRLLDEQSGNRPVARTPSTATGSESIFRPGQGGYQKQGPLHQDSGGASRFFYSAKTAKKERNAGLPEGTKNDHPTVKPIAVMRWLVKLVTPPGGTVLDPFSGSGTTGIACVHERFHYIGIDEDKHSVRIAKFRIRYAITERKKSRVPR